MSERHPTSPEQEPILSFEEFSARNEYDKPRYVNFWMHFSKGLGGDAYRQTDHYKKFAAENPDLDASLQKEMAFEGFSQDDLSAVDIELYEAYKIMRSNGATDKQLFA